MDDRLNELSNQTQPGSFFGGGVEFRHQIIDHLGLSVFIGDQYAIEIRHGLLPFRSVVVLLDAQSDAADGRTQSVPTIDRRGGGR